MRTTPCHRTAVPRGIRSLAEALELAVHRPVAVPQPPEPAERSSAQGGSTGVSYHLNSDASLVTGEYFQSHQGGIYQAQGVISGIDFQYSSLEAYPNPIFSALFKR